MYRSTLHWRPVDAATTPIRERFVALDETAKRGLWDDDPFEASSTP